MEKQASLFEGELELERFIERQKGWFFKWAIWMF
jgi:hypothetical protein